MAESREKWKDHAGPWLCNAFSETMQSSKGIWPLYKLTRRAKADAVLPTVEIADLREELKAGNRSIFSARLKELLEDRLEKGEQAMLFIGGRAMPFCPAIL